MPPFFSAEPEHMRQSKLSPLPRGAAIFRDLRTWHGGTPNLSDETRFLPSIEAVSKAFFAAAGESSGLRRCLPHKVFAELPPRCQARCEKVLAFTRLPTGVNRNFVRAQRTWEKGAGKGDEKR